MKIGVISVFAKWFTISSVECIRIDSFTNCGMVNEHAWSMLNIKIPRGKLFYSIPSPTTRKCILSILINIPQMGLLWKKSNFRFPGCRNIGFISILCYSDTDCNAINKEASEHCLWDVNRPHSIDHWCKHCFNRIGLKTLK